ncbi:YuzB family protein [Evansella sp. AB-rgal1]|uniref:YuzB family protein n=1 Tax=Evansella sp. AB-rgal1 TaxID=3242696 RepID=UPI00359DC80D
MQPIIEFCVSNLASGTQAVKEQLEKDPNLDVIEYGCLSFCGQCARKKFALVNGEVVTGDTNEELLTNIYQFIEDNPMF